MLNQENFREKIRANKRGVQLYGKNNRRKNIERLAKIAYETAKFNGKEFLSLYHEKDNPLAISDRINSSGYQYEVVERDSTGKRVCINYITINEKLGN